MSIIDSAKIVGDFACGTGYGSVMLAEKSTRVIGVDLSKKTINTIKMRYKNVENAEFVNLNCLNLKYNSLFDYIISFETIEHLKETDILKLFEVFKKALKHGGKLILSTPYMQETPPKDVKLNYHLTHEIDENVIKMWLSKNNFVVEYFKYQNYQTHEILDPLQQKDMLICVARKP